MRAPVAVVIAGVLFTPAPAVAQSGSPLCPIVPEGPVAYQAALVPLASSMLEAAREGLGPQYGGLWMDTPRQGWSVAASPGVLDATVARARIVQSLGTRLTPEQVAALEPRLTVLPTPYSEAELQAVQDQITPLFGSSDLLSGAGISCYETDGFRVYVGVMPEATPETVAQVQALLGHFGDRVHVQYGRPRAVPTGTGTGTLTPSPAPAPDRPAKPSLRVADYARLPRASRCVRGRAIGVRVAASADVRSVTLAAGKRKVTAGSGKRASLALKRRSTTVTVTVKLQDGRKGALKLTYRRCG